MLIINRMLLCVGVDANIVTVIIILLGVNRPIMLRKEKRYKGLQQY